MAKSATVQVRIEPELKKQVDSIIEQLGLTPSAAISMYYKQIVRSRGIPIELKIPNATTRTAIKEVRDPAFLKKAKRFKDVKSLLTDLKS